MTNRPRTVSQRHRNRHRRHGRFIRVTHTRRRPGKVAISQLLREGRISLRKLPRHRRFWKHIFVFHRSSHPRGRELPATFHFPRSFDESPQHSVDGGKLGKRHFTGRPAAPGRRAGAGSAWRNSSAVRAQFPPTRTAAAGATGEGGKVPSAAGTRRPSRALGFKIPAIATTKQI